MKEKHLNDKMNVCYYVVCFIDLLGQQDRLRELRSLPEKTNATQMATFVKALKETYGVVSGTRKLFRNFFKSYSVDIQRDLSSLTAEQLRQYNKMKSNPIHTSSFSDSVVAFTSLANVQNKLPVGGIYSVIAAASSIALLSLAAGYPVRGGIDIGIGMEIEKDEIYGPCLSRAYTLESKIAQYPRILVGQECLDYLNQTRKQDHKDVYSQAGSAMAQACLDLLTVDNDGLPIVDYLGKAFRLSIAQSLDKQIVKKAFSNVIKFSDACRNTKDTKLAFRYALLRKYFQHRLPEWEIEK